MEEAALSGGLRTCAVEHQDTSGSQEGTASEQLQSLRAAVSSLCSEGAGLLKSARGLTQAGFKKMYARKLLKSIIPFTLIKCGAWKP